MIAVALALATVGPNGPVLEPEPTVSAPVAVALAADRHCLARWRLRHAGAQVADAVTTIHIIESGKGTEANPLIRLIAGKRPKWFELAGIKAAGFALTEWQSQRAFRMGDGKVACRGHRTGAIVTAGVAALNLRVVF